MIHLLVNKEVKNNYLLHIIKRDEEAVWDICVGNWYGNPPIDIYGISFKTTKPILMTADDLLNFAYEIRNFVKEKPNKDCPYIETELNLSFKENEPKFSVRMRYGHEGANQKYSYVREGLYQFSPGINLKYSVVQDKREENQYLYEGEGRTQWAVAFYNEYEILQFAVDLEQEANK